jgi:hypothetical protein
MNMQINSGHGVRPVLRVTVSLATHHDYSRVLLRRGKAGVMLG